MREKYAIMVDPNRKINLNLSDSDAAFLVECEQDFRNRYTGADEEFAAFIAKPTRAPPVVEPWQNKRHHNDSSGGNWNRNNYRPNNRNHQGNHYNYNRNNDNRSQKNYRQHYNRPYDRNYRRDGDKSSGGGHGSSHSY